ncbi:hypothetical protein B9Z55_027369 [Caenorhabditis nigoni]|nr:hypothetical protein B9Z55_027369 [Caenorhabditis nigoni]
MQTILYLSTNSVIGQPWITSIAVRMGRILRFGFTVGQIAGYEININDLFNSPPKTEDVQNNTNHINSVEYDYPSTERSEQEGIYEYITEFSKPTIFFKKYCCRLLAALFLASLVAVSIIVFLIVPPIFHHSGTATTSTVAPDSTPATKITTKILTTGPTRIATQNFEKTSTSPEETTATSRTSIKSTYSPEPDDTSCVPTGYSSTFLLAYSNDLPVEAVLDTWFAFYYNNNSAAYSWYGSVRLDTTNIDMNFHTSINETTDTIVRNLPWPSLGFQSSEIGSNVFDVIAKFFANTEAPVCGSTILVLLKRFPNESDNSRLVSLIRSHHAILHVVTSETPSGGSQPKTMYSVASKTNGIGAIECDKYFDIIGACLWYDFKQYKNFSARCQKLLVTKD